MILHGVSVFRSFRCLWALQETGLDYDYIEMAMGSDAPSDGVQSAGYKAKNPQSKVPTLVDGDFVLTESAAILNYINHKAGGRFIPEDAKLRAKYDELSFFVLAELEQPLWTMSKHKFALPSKQRVETIVPTAHWEFAKAQNALLELFNLDGFVIGKQFSFADILLAQTIHWAQKVNVEIDQRCIAYQARMFARQACQQALEKIKSVKPLQ